MNGDSIKAVLNNLRDVQILSSIDGSSIHFVNDAVLRVFGISPEELQASPDLRFAQIHAEDRAAVRHQVAQTAETQIPFRTEYRLCKLDGTVIWVVEHSQVVDAPDCDRLLLTTIQADGISEGIAHFQHLKAQQSIAQVLADVADTELAMSRSLEIIGTCLGWQVCEFWTPSDDGACLRLSSNWCDPTLGNTEHFTAVSRSIALDSSQVPQGKAWKGGSPLWTVGVVESEPVQRQSDAAQLNLKTALSFPVEVVGANFGVVSLYSCDLYGIDTSILQTADAIGKLLAQYLQRARLLKNFADSEQRFRQLFDENEAVKLVIDPENGSIVAANPAAASYYGYSLDQLCQMRIEQINSIEQHDAHKHLLNAVDQRRNRFLFHHRTASGAVRQVEVHSCPLIYEGRKLLYSTIFDVTDKLRIAAALHESDERIRLVFKHCPTAIAILDRELRYLFATEAWIKAHRLGGNNVVGRPHFETFPDIDGNWRKIFDRALAGETVESHEEQVGHADGTFDWIRCVVSPWRTSDDQIGGIIAFTESVKEEKFARDALRESEGKYRALFENLIDGFALHKIVTDQNGKAVDYVFLEINDAFEQMTGLKRENIIGRPVTEAIPGIERSPEDWIGVYARVALNGETVKFEREAADLKRWFSISAYCPKAGYFVTVFEDITARKRAEAELQEQQRAIANLLSNLPGMAYRCRNDHDWSMEYISEGCIELTGYSPQELQLNGIRTYNDLILPDDRSFVWNEVQRAIREHRPYRLSYRLVTRSSQIKFVWEQGNAIFDGQGEFVALEGFIGDISERIRAEEALKSREEHFRALIDNSSDIITLINSEGRLLYLSPSIERVLGYKADELQGTSIFKWIHRDDRRFAREISKRAMIRGGTDISSEMRIRHKNGSWRILEMIGRNLLDDPHVGAIVVNSRDITERRNIENERSQLATAVEQATESIVITDVDGKIIYVNSAFEKISGYLLADVTGQNARILKSGEHSAEYYREMWATLRNGEPWAGRFKNRRKNGTLYEEECTISPIKDGTGKVINFVAVKRDITKEVELEDRLRQAQKLEAVGRLASGIAHDFNNLLAGIRGFAELICQEAQETPKLCSHAEEIIKAASRAADLTSQLLAFARKGNYLSVPVSLHDTIGEVTNILKHTIDRRIEIRTELLASRPMVKGDPSQIQSAILNLSVNARDAMPNGGRLTFTTRNITLDDDYCLEHSLDQGPGTYLAVTVADSGFGIDESIRSHIFDPFFTTKEQGQGTGLGLAGVYGCVRNHHGSVDVASEVGKGTAFTLLLPALENVDHTVPHAIRDLPLTGCERILVVDDEEIVRNLAERMLTKAGYIVVSCENGEEAVRLYRTAIGSIDLVLLDMMMPKMNGHDTFVAMKQFNPDVKVLLMSGFSDRDVQGNLAEGIVGFIHKPFQMRAFLMKIRAALDLRTGVRQT